jgi:hypothetical protein
MSIYVAFMAGLIVGVIVIFISVLAFRSGNKP